MNTQTWIAMIVSALSGICSIITLITVGGRVLWANHEEKASIKKIPVMEEKMGRMDSSITDIKTKQEVNAEVAKERDRVYTTEIRDVRGKVEGLVESVARIEGTLGSSAKSGERK